MIKTFGCFFFIVFSATVSIYTFKVDSIGGQEIDFDNFRGKKMLVVNIATGSADTQQLYLLQQLYEQYSDSLVIVAFPSNSFGNEPHSNAEIQGILNDTYHVTFPVAGISDITGEGANAIYKWIANKDDNGVLKSIPKTDYWKYLISSKGEIIGVFTEAVSPMNSKVTNAVMSAL